MKLSNRKKLEIAICEKLNAELSRKDFIYKEYPDDNEFHKIGIVASWQISFHLWGGAPFHFMDHLWVKYDELTEIIHQLLKNSRFEEDILYWSINVGTHVSNYWPRASLRTVSSLDEVDVFVVAFMEALSVAERDFLIPYSDVSKAANECTLFYTKWPREMGHFKSAFCLIGYGIKNKEIEKIQMGVDRIRKKIDLCQTEKEKELMLAVANEADKSMKLLRTGVAPSAAPVPRPRPTGNN